MKRERAGGGGGFVTTYLVLAADARVSRHGHASVYINVFVLERFIKDESMRTRNQGGGLESWAVRRDTYLRRRNTGLAQGGRCVCGQEKLFFVITHLSPVNRILLGGLGSHMNNKLALYQFTPSLIPQPRSRWCCDLAAVKDVRWHFDEMRRQ